MQHDVTEEVAINATVVTPSIMVTPSDPAFPERLGGCLGIRWLSTCASKVPWKLLSEGASEPECFLFLPHAKQAGCKVPPAEVGTGLTDDSLSEQ